MTGNSSDFLIDFDRVWRAYVTQRPGARLASETDLAFWESYAALYDERTAMPGSYSQTLRALQQIVRPTDTVLDVGAGTGRFAIPLAGWAQSVTALDHSPAMLAELRGKLAQASTTNIQIVQAAWEEADVQPHDVVLAAWSLYRQIDITSALARLEHATRRALVIVSSGDLRAPHRPLVKEIWGRDGEPDIPVCLYLLGALWQIGLYADLHMVSEQRVLEANTPLTIARRLAPLAATPAELNCLADGMLPLCQRQRDGWRYEYSMPVGLIVWNRLAGEELPGH